MGKIIATFGGRRMSVNDSIEAIKNKVKRKAARVIREASVEMATMIKYMTPVDTGNTAANWTIGLHGYKEPYDPRAEDYVTPLDDGNLKGFKAGGSITIHNSAPATRPLEYGWSKQAPSGMVRINLLQWNTYLKRALARVGDKT